MEHEEVIAMMDAIKAAILEELETDVEYAYDHFAEGEAPDPPFICFRYPESRDFVADDSNYHKMKELDIELYTDYKDPDLEDAVEAQLEAYEIVSQKTEAWIESERLYEVLYEMTI